MLRNRFFTRRWLLSSIGLGLLLILIYLFSWPVPIDPQPWQAPNDRGYSDDFAVNQHLAGLELIDLGGAHGPEDCVVDDQGNVWLACADGSIVKVLRDAKGNYQARPWLNTGGRPLGLAFDLNGDLIIADAYRGLLRADRQGELHLLSDKAAGIPIRYANNCDVAADGRIYFSDSSSKFAAAAWGGTLAASVLDLMEHGGHGRLLCYDPRSGSTTVLLEGLQFANGVAVSHDQQAVLVVETGIYAVRRLWLEGPQAGHSEVLLNNLPGFPDNLRAGSDGRYWLGLVSPRNALLDGLAGKPGLRRMVQRLPSWLRPQASSYGHIIAFDGQGKILVNLQDPSGAYALTTGATESSGGLYVSSLTMPQLGRLDLQQALSATAPGAPTPPAAPPE